MAEARAEMSEAELDLGDPQIATGEHSPVLTASIDLGEEVPKEKRSRTDEIPYLEGEEDDTEDAAADGADTDDDVDDVADPDDVDGKDDAAGAATIAASGAGGPVPVPQLSPPPVQKMTPPPRLPPTTPQMPTNRTIHLARRT